MIGQHSTVEEPERDEEAVLRSLKAHVPPQQAGAIGVEHMLPLVLDVCPSFTERHRRTELELRSTEENGRLRHERTIESFADHVVLLALSGRRAELPWAFHLIEQFHRRGDDEVGALASNVLLSGLRSGATSSGRDPEVVFRSWLGPASTLAWDALSYFALSCDEDASPVDRELAGLAQALGRPDRALEPSHASA